MQSCTCCVLPDLTDRNLSQDKPDALPERRSVRHAARMRGDARLHQRGSHYWQRTATHACNPMKLDTPGYYKVSTTASGNGRSISVAQPFMVSSGGNAPVVPLHALTWLPKTLLL